MIDCKKVCLDKIFFKGPADYTGLFVCFVSSFCDRYNNPTDTSETKDSAHKSLSSNFLTIFTIFMETLLFACYARIVISMIP